MARTSVVNQQQKRSYLRSNRNLPDNAQWVQEAVTVAGGNEKGDAPSQLNHPHGLYIDDDQTILITDYGNHRIVKWTPDATSVGGGKGQVVAGGNRGGDGLHQLFNPTDVIVDKKTDSLIICDAMNNRVMRWSRQNRTNGGPIISNITCWGLAMDDKGFLYVSDRKKAEVRRYTMDETNGTVAEGDNGIVVAGGNGRGEGPHQLAFPTYLFVDQKQSVYVSDSDNNRAMKWDRDATTGCLVASDNSGGNAMTQLSNPQGVFVDQLGRIYVADSNNHRIMRWYEGNEVEIIAGGRNGPGKEPNQLLYPVGLSFDQQGNLYVVDNGNHRVQRFSIKASCTDEVSMNINGLGMDRLQNRLTGLEK
ncbi:unnamed protein product [Didymodactylos carnosus]|uniref:NHL repeat-containing protein n=1 Tax=Didymodactylos carnosus TaxID=1234261 RepID=A0A814QVU1_9BILA|nr:unnamed protein product [Didymodactylos carnosus]CAF3888482.1 unnamed protein product [Didymodactylos carnosus]